MAKVWAPTQEKVLQVEDHKQYKANVKRVCGGEVIQLGHASIFLNANFAVLRLPACEGVFGWMPEVSQSTAGNVDPLSGGHQTQQSPVPSGVLEAIVDGPVTYSSAGAPATSTDGPEQLHALALPDLLGCGWRGAGGLRGDVRRCTVLRAVLRAGGATPDIDYSYGFTVEAPSRGTEEEDPYIRGSSR
ncbi:hypothetical protein CYMTET_43456 [Cymbomonas tetramitiformis]|uniref:Uncharacterized protein n=1 Tax=Cymbomonas tetramitiformis TaxID=36881 RepID=A0AAE0C476_9CHLO|nr:hypothetical protein CYMTET_43456 [Cymbomonas tetramitiformis]